jgi:uncharacterized membrane protein
MQAELLALRVIHIVGGIFWVGATMFTSFYLLPVLTQSGPAASHVMMGLQKRRLMVVMPITAVLTILSGLRLMMITSSRFSGDYFAMASGRTYAISGLAAILALVVGLAVGRPTAARMSALSHMAASGETDRQTIAAEVRRLQKRAATASLSAVVLLLFAAIGMAIARYL